MKRLTLLFLFQFWIVLLMAQLAPIDKVHPLSWWTGMVNPELQIMVRGNHISDYEAQINYEGVTLKKVHKVENPNYLFLDLLIDKSAKPGTLKINFTQRGKKAISHSFALRERDNSPNRIQGVTSADLIYLIMPDRFSNGDPTNDRVKGMREQTLNRDSMYYRHGGDLQGIMNHLDYIKDLGVTAIWNTPEIENDMTLASYHGYAATDFYNIDPRYGTNELYKKYVEKCHSMGIKVIKDLVHNHIGSEGWMMTDLPMKDWVNQWPVYTNSSYRDQPTMDIHASKSDRLQMVNGWFVPTMPDLNQRNSFVAKYLTQNHIWWIEYAGIDGLRLDTYPFNDAEFMARWAQDMKAQFPNLSIFGECLVQFTPNQAFFTEGNTVNRGFDTHLPGITDAVMKDAIIEALNGKENWVDGINRLYAIVAQDFLYKDATQNVIFLDNHDMSRFFSMVNEDFDKFKSGMGILLTMRGIPQMYYGTEILMKNFSAPDGLVREDFKGGWQGDSINKFTSNGRDDRENEAFNFIKTLANFRKNSSALQTGKLMQYIPQQGVYVYFRYDDKQTVMVIVNSNTEKKQLSTDRFSERVNGFTQGENVITHEKISLGNISLPPKSTVILSLGN